MKTASETTSSFEMVSYSYQPEQVAVMGDAIAGALGGQLAAHAFSGWLPRVDAIEGSRAPVLSSCLKCPATPSKDTRSPGL